MAAPRDYFVCVFPDDTITGREQHEFVWKVQAFDVEPHAAVGYFDYVAGARDPAMKPIAEQTTKAPFVHSMDVSICDARLID